jgi:hypothetical protein
MAPAVGAFRKPASFKKRPAFYFDREPWQHKPQEFFVGDSPPVAPCYLILSPSQTAIVRTLRLRTFVSLTSSTGT